MESCKQRIADIPQVTLIEESSHVIGPTWNSQLAICLIDGDHSEDGAYQDLLDFSPWVRQRGILIIDDVWMSPAVNAAVNRWKRHEVADRWEPMIESCAALRCGDGAPMFKWEAWRRLA